MNSELGYAALYDNVHNRLAKTDPHGLQTQYSYDVNGNVTSVTNPSGSTLAFDFFNTFNQPQKLRDPNGNYSVLKYDANGNLTGEIRLRNGIDPGDPGTYTPVPAELIAWTIHTYDSLGNRLSTRRARDFLSLDGPVVTTTYDANGLYPVGIERCGDQDGDTVINTPAECDSASLVYDVFGRMEQGIRADWETVRYQYDELDRLIQGTDANGKQRDYLFDANGNPVGNADRLDRGWFRPLGPTGNRAGCGRLCHPVPL